MILLSCSIVSIINNIVIVIAIASITNISSSSNTTTPPETGFSFLVPPSPQYNVEWWKAALSKQKTSHMSVFNFETWGEGVRRKTEVKFRAGT